MFDICLRQISGVSHVGTLQRVGSALQAARFERWNLRAKQTVKDEEMRDRSTEYLWLQDLNPGTVTRSLAQRVVYHSQKCLLVLWFC